MADATLKFDLSAFEKMAESMDVAQRQLPFALSRALNQSAFATRDRLINETWPSHVTERNKSFIRWALGIEPATKSELTVRITDKRAQGRGNIALHADSGTKTVERGNVAVPVAGQRLGPRGIVPSQRPRNVKRSFKKGDAIYAITGKGKNKRLKLLYVLKSSVKIPKDVPMREDFRRSMIAEMQVRAPAAMLDAMKTAVRK
ncbi:hypothetical protein LMIY3S_03682 [Labrys miyagiensis]